MDEKSMIVILFNADYWVVQPMTLSRGCREDCPTVGNLCFQGFMAYLGQMEQENP